MKYTQDDVVVFLNGEPIAMLSEISEIKQPDLISQVPIFNWMELNNKTIKIKCYEEDGTTIVAGYDKSSGAMYILHTENKNV